MRSRAGATAPARAVMFHSIEGKLTMRSFCTCLAVVGLLASLSLVAPGCGGTSELEKPPEVKKVMDPMTDMPGYKEAQEKYGKKGKAK